MHETLQIQPHPGPGVVCAIWREVADAQLIASTIPASTYACLNFIAHGQVQIIGEAQALPPAFVTGPLSKPIHTETCGPMRSLSLAMPAWQLQSWLQLAPAQLANRLAALDQQRFAALHDAIDNPPLLAAALASLAMPEQASDRRAAQLAQALTEQRSLTVAARRCHVSVRQFERQFLAAHGLAPREWLRIRRFETSLMQLTGAQPLAHVAAETGYADQAHMARDYRRSAGHAPRSLKDAVRAETPGYWAFQPAAQYRD